MQLALGRTRSTRMVSIEEHLQQDIAELDASNPEWDHDMIVANAAYQLKSGMRPADIELIFGVAVLEEAQQNLTDDAWCTKNLGPRP